jgi:hypothetical protein
MIEATDLLQKMGKKKFIEYASKSQKGETMAKKEKRERWGKGKVFTRICEHNKITIRCGKETHACSACDSSTSYTKLRDFEPHFNMGLGCYVESKSEMKQLAKDRGMVNIGDDKL